MKRKPERTCIGCRGIFSKDEVVRIVSGPSGPVFDYREKLPGRAAYVCPKRECIAAAASRDALSRAFRLKVAAPDPGKFIALLVANINEKSRSLIAIAAKAGKLSAGYSAVHDALEKNRVEMLVYASDISEGTRKKISAQAEDKVHRRATLFTRDELGMVLNRELVSVIGLEDEGLADALWRETERLKSLINNDQ